MALERRVYTRAMVRTPAALVVAADEAEEHVLLHDLSASGASIHTRTLLAVGREVHLRFALGAEGDPEIDAACLVVRNAALRSPDRGFDFVAGLHFLDLDGERQRRVNEFVWSLLEPGRSKD